jgi:uncharacterized protein (TIGR00255 family)
MTGFGTAEQDVADCRVRVDVRTVNHRFFHCTLRLPSELTVFEAPVRELLKRGFDRGHITLGMSVDPATTTRASVVDWDRAATAVAALRELTERFDLAGEVTADVVSRFPEVVTVRRTELPAIAWEELEPVVALAVDECLAARRREGTALSGEIIVRLAAMESAASRVEALLPARFDRELVRLRRHVSELAAGVTVDGDRLAQEVAILADKLDVTEELVRLREHLRAAEAAVASEGPVGKQLGFLAQELGREVNTIGSKANDATIAHAVVGMKGELEKVREQLENLE